MTYKIDPAHSSAQFIVRHMMITNVRGGFSGVNGIIEYDPANPGDARVDATIDVATIGTRQSAGYPPEKTRLPSRRAVSYHHI